MILLLGSLYWSLMMNKEILFLDDSKDRHDNFKRRTIGHDVTHVWSAAEAIKELTEHNFAQVFLDHDLSEEDILIMVGEKSKVPTGMDVVNFIMKMDNPPPDIIIHSCIYIPLIVIVF